MEQVERTAGNARVWGSVPARPDDGEFGCGRSIDVGYHPETWGAFEAVVTAMGGLAAAEPVEPQNHVKFRGDASEFDLFEVVVYFPGPGDMMLAADDERLVKLQARQREAKGGEG